MSLALSGRRIVFIALLSTIGSPADAHEFWLAPHRYTVAPRAEIVASLRVGQMLQGTELPYSNGSFVEFTIQSSAGAQAATGSEGDMPALSMAARSEGLHVVTYHSTPNVIKHEDPAHFQEYIAHEGLESVADAGRCPSKGTCDEAYTRYAKTLIQVGSNVADYRDEARGAPLELVAGDNPYRPRLGVLPIRLLRLGKPVPNRRITLIHYDGRVEESFLETDATGRAEISLSGGGTFLLNAIDLQPVERESIQWESHWASLTFGLPIATPEHPLDPLARIEIVRAVQIIGKSGHATRDTRVALLTLDEPDKDNVLAWQARTPYPRRALAVVRNGTDVFEAKIDLLAGELISWSRLSDVQTAITSGEWDRARALVKADQRWLAAIRSRGYEDASEIFCDALPAGYYGERDSAEPRTVKLPCYDVADARTNIYGRPIEGLIAVVDLDEGKVTRVIDTGPMPVSEESHELGGGDDLKAPRSQATAPPPGASYTLDGRVVRWQAWSFHVGFDPRFGSVLSLVQHADGSQRRMILYQGHLSEVFVPYMDADESWYFRTPMDAGEYGLGMLASPLASGLDCPADATFFDADVARPVGDVYTRPRVVCVFERDTDAPLWRHWEALNGAQVGRRASELVVRSAPTIGNYDYIIDWVFTGKGEIHIDIGATGIDAVKGVAVKSMREPDAEEVTRSGMLVAPNLVAVHHDHYFSLRLDLDIDGATNSFVRQALTPKALPDTVPRRSLWELERRPMDAEGGLSMRQGPELWRVENPESETVLGHRRSYQITGGHTATSLLSPQDWPQRRGAFSGETLWVTARRPGELFAGGPFPNQGRGDGGLPAYVDGESVTSTDIVAWYTVGFHHLTRPEDWPVLPTIWHRVKLRPYGFFSRSPAVD
jgi:primary-amine oxidase